MEHIWQEMAEKMMAKDPSMFARDASPEDLAAAMADAWGQDRAAAIRATEDVICRAEDCHNAPSMPLDIAREILYNLTDEIEGGSVFDILDDMIYDKIGMVR